MIWVWSCYLGDDMGVVLLPFSLTELFTSQKRLKLLLMPLVVSVSHDPLYVSYDLFHVSHDPLQTSAARNKQEQVENARISAYWHLIGHLGHHKEELFQQVHVQTIWNLVQNSFCSSQNFNLSMSCDRPCLELQNAVLILIDF